MASLVIDVTARSGPLGRCVQARVELSGFEEADAFALDTDEERVLADLTTRVAGACAALDEGARQRAGDAP